MVSKVSFPKHENGNQPIRQNNQNLYSSETANILVTAKIGQNIITFLSLSKKQPKQTKWPSTSATSRTQITLTRGRCLFEKKHVTLSLVIASVCRDSESK